MAAELTGKCSAPIKWSSVAAPLMLVASSRCRIFSGLRFALFYGGELLESSNLTVEMSMFVFCSMMLQVKEVLQSYLLPDSAAMRT